jgi:hypothetical protein
MEPINYRSRAFELINKTPLDKKEDDLMGWWGLRQIETTIISCKKYITLLRKVKDNIETINEYENILMELYSIRKLAMSNTSTYKTIL